jgi:E3 ubiquitin-protein ligase HERC2
MSKISASTMSMVAATLKSNSQVIGVTETDIGNPSLLDDFTSLLGLNDARILVDLLKLAVAGRVGDSAKETLTNILKVLTSTENCVATMLLELCVIELEDVALNNNILQTSPQPIIQESAHPYNNQVNTSEIVRIPGKH